MVFTFLRSICNQPRPFGFTRAGLYCNYGLIPLVVIMGLHLTAIPFYIAYMLNTRDHVVNRSRKPINERMDLLNPYYLKLLVINPYLKPPYTQLHNAYEQMRLADEEREREVEEFRRGTMQEEEAPVPTKKRPVKKDNLDTDKKKKPAH